MTLPTKHSTVTVSYLFYLVAGVRLELTTSDLWERRANLCSIPQCKYIIPQTPKKSRVNFTNLGIDFKLEVWYTIMKGKSLMNLQQAKCYYNEASTTIPNPFSLSNRNRKLPISITVCNKNLSLYTLELNYSKNWPLTKKNYVV